MWLRMDLDGITVELQIQQYTKRNARADDEWDYWCEVSFFFFSEPWLNYKKENDEVFLSYEIDNLAQDLDDLLNDRFSKPVKMRYVEPDFCFELSPKGDFRNSSRILYIRHGQEIVDISMKWKVYFWHDGLTENYLTVTMDRKNIINLKNYLFWVTGKYNESTPEIIDMKEKGILY